MKMNHNMRIYVLAVLTAFCVQICSLSHAQVRDGAREENLVVSAVARIQSGDMKTAGAILGEAVAEDPSNDAAWYYLSTVHAAENRMEEAEKCLKKASELDPGNFWYRYRLAAIYSLTSRPELTVDIYEGLLKDFPKKSELYFDMAELYSSQKEYDKALKTLDDIETIFGMNESLAIYRFNLLRMTDRQDEAYESLKKYNEEYSSPYVLSTLADHEISIYNDSTALVYYNEALDLAPDYAPALLGKAETLRMTRKYDEYFEVLDRFVADPQTPSDGKCDYLSAVVQRSDPKFIRMFARQLDSVMLKTLETHPADSLVNNMAGLYYYSTQRPDKAVERFKASVDLWPESLAANASYVELLMYAGMWEEVSREGRNSFERFPKETAFLEMASMGDYNLKEYGKVLEICDKVLEVAPADSSATLRAWSTKGDIYHQLGDVQKSYKAYDKALKINPEYVYVLNNYAYYLSMEGKKLKKAYDMSLKTVEAEPDNATYLDTFGWILYLQGKALEAKPFFKKAMLYGGKDSVVIIDHYAEVLYALGEYDMAFVYWNMALQKNDGKIPGLEEKIMQRKEAAGK